MKTPKFKTAYALYEWRLGLLVFGIIASVAIAALQHLDWYPAGAHSSFFDNSQFPSWSLIKPSLNYSGQQFQVYGSQGQGRATASGGSVTRIANQPGTAFDSAWVGLPFFYYHKDGDDLGTRLIVTAVADEDNLTATLIGGGAPGLSGLGTYHFVADVSVTTVDCSGTTCTKTGGDNFSGFSSLSQPSYVRINGTLYVVTASTSTTITLQSSLNVTGAIATQYSWDYDTISLLRVQKYLGTTEEAMLFGARAIGPFEIRSTVSGVGQYRAIIAGTGSPGGGALYSQVWLHPNGELSLGGGYGNDILRIAPSDGSVGSNFWYAPKAPAGFGPSLSARTNIGATKLNATIDALGAGCDVLSNGSFARFLFLACGTGADYLQVTATTGAPSLSAKGSSANVDIKVIPKGTGYIDISASETSSVCTITRYINVKINGTLRKMPLCD